MFNRVFLIVLDSFGIGSYTNEDDKANTALHVIEKSELEFNSLKQLGLYNLLDKENIKTIGYYTTSAFNTPNKDSLSRLREMMGLDIKTPYKAFKDGLNEELVNKIETECNIKIICNKLGNGIDIINQYTFEHLKTKSIILSTSYDSILYVYCHINVLNKDELYEICKKIKEITDEKEEWNVSRIVLNTFSGDKNHYVILPNETAITSKLQYRSVLNYLKESSFQTITIGKIVDYFNNSGVTSNYKTLDNLDGLNRISEAIKSDFSGLCFANLSDLDIYASKKDIFGYTKCLKQIDQYLPLLVNATKEDDLLIITSDNGNDPSLSYNSHTKELVPVFIYSKRFIDPKRMNKLNTVADISATIANIFEINNSELGSSFKDQLK